MYAVDARPVARAVSAEDVDVPAILVTHSPYFDKENEYIECGCGQRFTGSKAWAVHVAARLAGGDK